MPWLTPDDIPEDGDCRPLLIPASSAWLALVSGALTELTKPYNWQKFGTLTVQETVDEMQSIIDNYYNSPCAMCVTPGDYRVTRISPAGHLQELDPSGDWVDATGDYAIPAPAARTEGTAPDQNCLAAKNATQVLEQLYESLSESYASEFSTDEAILAFITAAVAIIGFEFAPITWSIAAFAFIGFEALFKALEYITADLWTDDFSKQFECLLLNCANNDAGVVTFDWDCFNAALLAQVNDMGLSEVQMRLYVQIGYILYFIGGADGLNLAGRTTDITNDDCSFCPSGGSLCVTFDDGDVYEFIGNPDFDLVPAGHLNPDFGNPAPSGHSDTNFSYGNYQIAISVRIDLGAPQHVTDASFEYFWYSDAPGGDLYRAIFFLDNDAAVISSQVMVDAAGQSEWLSQPYTGSPVTGCRYVVAAMGQTSGTPITGELTVDNICATWDGS